jgi:hypothetical protein
MHETTPSDQDRMVWVMAFVLPLRSLCIMASLSVIGLLVVSDFGSEPTDRFSELDQDGHVEVFCTAIRGSYGAKGLMLDVQDSDGLGWKAFCPNGTYPSDLGLPCSVRIVGETAKDSPRIIFVDRLEPLYGDVQSRQD